MSTAAEVDGVVSEEEEQQRLNEFSMTLGKAGLSAVVPSVLNVALETRSTKEPIMAASYIDEARSECERLVKEDKECDASFWMPASASPCSLHELIALSIFEAHTFNIDFDPANR